MLFSDWQLWEKVVLILGCCIYLIILVGCAKLLYNRRQLRKSAENLLARAELARGQAMTRSVSRITITSTTIAKTSSIRVDGVRNPRSSSPVRSLGQRSTSNLIYDGTPNGFTMDTMAVCPDPMPLCAVETRRQSRSTERSVSKNMDIRTSSADSALRYPPRSYVRHENGRPHRRSRHMMSAENILRPTSVNDPRRSVRSLVKEDTEQRGLSSFSVSRPETQVLREVNSGFSVLKPGSLNQESRIRRGANDGRTRPPKPSLTSRAPLSTSQETSGYSDGSLSLSQTGVSDSQASLLQSQTGYSNSQASLLQSQTGHSDSQASLSQSQTGYSTLQTLLAGAHVEESTCTPEPRELDASMEQSSDRDHVVPLQEKRISALSIGSKETYATADSEDEEAPTTLFSALEALRRPSPLEIARGAEFERSSIVKFCFEAGQRPPNTMEVAKGAEMELERMLKFMFESGQRPLSANEMRRGGEVEGRTKYKFEQL